MKAKSSYRQEVNGGYEEDDEKEWWTQGQQQNGTNGNDEICLIKEVDIAQLPKHLLDKLSKVEPQEGGVLSPDDVQSDDGAWIIQCPKNMELHRLIKGKKIHLNGRPSVLIDEEDYGNQSVSLPFPHKKYEAVSVNREEDKPENIFLLLPDLDGQFKMVSAPLNGHIIIRQHIEELPPPEISIPRKKIRKLPSGIKERHPIYGVDFSHANSSKKVTVSPKKYSTNQLKNSFSDYSEEFSFTKAKQAKKAKRKESLSSNFSHSDEITVIKSKHHKGSKQDLQGYSEQASLVKSKSKRKKENYEEEPSPPVYYEEIVIESPIKKKSSKKRNREEFELEDESEVIPIKSKKAKKMKVEPIHEVEVINNSDYEIGETPRKSKKAKKMKSEPVYEEEVINIYDSEIEKTPRKSKKSKKSKSRD